MLQMDMVTTRVVGTIPTLGIIIREAGVGTKGAAVMGLVMAAGHGEVVVIKTMATTASRTIVGDLLETNSIVITALRHTT